MEVGDFAVVETAATTRKHLTTVEQFLRLLHLGELASHVGETLGVTLESGQHLVNRLEVGQDQLSFDGGNVAGRVDAPVNVNDVVIFKDAHHFTDGIGLTDRGQELVTKSFTFTRAFYDAGDVDERHRGRQDALGTENGGQLGETSVRHGHDTHVGLNGREGVVRRQHVVVGQCVKESGLSDVGESDDAD